MTDYANPEMLVGTDWVRDHLDDPAVRLVEVGADRRLYDAGHIEGAVFLGWGTELQDQVVRDIVSQEVFEKNVGQVGITRESTVVLYGDDNNWYAAYALWLFKHFGHSDARLMNGGRTKWLTQPKQKFVDEPTALAATGYSVAEPNAGTRVMLMDVLQTVGQGTVNLVDARTPDEYTGRTLTSTVSASSASAARGGHIPGAINVPWSASVNSDGTFKTADELNTLYFERKKIDRSKPTITYCSTGERASHAWYVLKYLLGLDNVRNYDGGWAEYGSMIGAPIER